MIVPSHVAKFTTPFGNVTKYAEIIASNAHLIYLWSSFSLRKIQAVVIAKIGCNFCKRNTTEIEIKCTLPSAVVNQSVPKSPLKTAIKTINHHSRLVNLVARTYL